MAVLCEIFNSDSVHEVRPEKLCNFFIFLDSKHWSNDVCRKILARAGVIVVLLLAVRLLNEAYMK